MHTVPSYRAGTPGSPAVLVLQEIFGLNRYIRGVCDTLAEAGFLAVAPEVFHRASPGFLAGYDAEGMAAGRAQVAALDHAVLQADLGAVVSTLRSDGNGRVGVLGFCYGGLLAWDVHALHGTDAGVCYYGRAQAPTVDGRAPLERTGQFRGPFLAHFASDDPSIPGDVVAACAAALHRSPARATVELWPGTHHGFHCWDRAAHHPESAARSWELTLALFRRTLG